MDPIKNPYSPNAGAPPPAFVGRGAVLTAFATALGRIQIGKSQKSMLPTGLRGVGKTVLLNRFAEQARALGYLVAQIEASESETFMEALASEARTTLYELSAKAKIRGAVSKALGVLKSFTLTFDMAGLSVQLGVDPQVGAADSGILSNDLTALLVAMGQAAREEQTAVLIAIDELQYLNEEQLAAIIMAVHRVTQLALPLLVVGTGLPQLPALAGNAKSYAERLFDYPAIGALSREEAFEAIRKPARSEGVDIEDAALERLYKITKGYPYFVQEWAYRVWNLATKSPIALDDVDRAEPEVLAR
ncbi:MAG: ATP-binding protein, partial [Candidatus Eremiobacteraeota bacterium]|nr:ATP-binding protein [Candidatus Eremiobacteraeota bacterium]